MNGLTLEVLSFDGQILKEDSVEIVNIDTTTGPISILKGHAPLITALNIGVLSYIKRDKKDGYIALGVNGFAEILDNRISVIVNTAEKQENIDLARAIRAKERSEVALKNNIDSKSGLKVEIALKKSLVRILCKEGKCR